MQTKEISHDGRTNEISLVVQLHPEFIICRFIFLARRCLLKDNQLRFRQSVVNATGSNDVGNADAVLTLALRPRDQASTDAALSASMGHWYPAWPCHWRQS